MEPPPRFWHSRPKLLALGAILAVLAFATGYFTHKRPTSYVVGVPISAS